MSKVAAERKVNIHAGASRKAAMFGAALAVAMLAAGCSAISDDAKPDATYGGTPSTAPADATFPDLRDVPTQAPAVTSLDDRKDLAKGLVADRKQALHSSEVLRGGTEAPASAPVINRPTPVPALGDVPANTANDKQSLYMEAPVLPVPGRGGHRNLAAVMKPVGDDAPVRTAAAELPPATTAAANTAAEAAGGDMPEVTPAPTSRVTVKPAIGQP